MMSRTTYNPQTTFKQPAVQRSIPQIGQVQPVQSHQNIGEFKGQDFVSNQAPFRQANNLPPYDLPPPP